jgi:DNA-directed RNA polymerase subunit M/transcription elongation factor TFIIS
MINLQMEHPLRQRIRKILCEISPENEKKMINVEIGVFNYSLDNCSCMIKNWSNESFKNFYKSRCREMIYNLRPKNNPFLLKRYLDGEIEPLKLSQMSHREMYPERYYEADFFSKEDIKAVMTPTNTVTDSLLKCPKCRLNMVSYYEMMIRSGDEPATLFSSCHNPECGHKFTIN